MKYKISNFSSKDTSMETQDFLLVGKYNKALVFLITYKISCLLHVQIRNTYMSFTSTLTFEKWPFRVLLRTIIILALKFEIQKKVFN